MNTLNCVARWHDLPKMFLNVSHKDILTLYERVAKFLETFLFLRSFFLFFKVLRLFAAMSKNRPTTHFPHFSYYWNKYASHKQSLKMHYLLLQSRYAVTKDIHKSS